MREESCQGKIMLPGWAGELSDGEVEMIYRRLKCSLKLRQKWGIRGERVSRDYIRRVAVEGLPSREAARAPPQLRLFPEIEDFRKERDNATG